MSADATAQKGVDLNELQGETEKLLALLQSRHPRLMTWNGLMRERMQNMQRLVNAALA